MKKSALMLVLLGSIVVVPMAMAQVKHIEMRVEGMTWNFWAYGVKQSLGRQSGVQKVDVNLLDGKVDVTPKEDGHIDPIQLLKATYDSGVSTAEMDMTARGHIVTDSSGALALQVEPNQSFALEPNALSQQLRPLAGTATNVTVRGQLYRKPAGKKKPPLPRELKLLILEVQKKE